MGQQGASASAGRVGTYLLEKLWVVPVRQGCHDAAATAAPLVSFMYVS